MKKIIEQLLYKQLDGQLTPHENDILDQAVKNDPQVKKEMERILQMRELVSSTKKDEFKPFFETRVMHRINSGVKSFAFQDLFADTMARQFRKILVPAMIVILALATYNLGSADSINFNSLLGVPDVSLADSIDPINFLGLE